MKIIVWILLAVVGIFTTQGAVAANSQCGNRASFVKGPQLTVFALTADQRLLSFRECSPTRLRDIGSVSGLQAPDAMIVGIDFRVQDGKLYGVGNQGGIYTIDVSTAVVTLVSRLTMPLDGDFFGVDFNPAANALRIISNTGQNLRHPFAGALMGMTQTDTTLNYPGPPAVKSGDRPDRCRLYEQRSRSEHRDEPIQHRHILEPSGHSVATQCRLACGDRPADRQCRHACRLRHLHNAAGRRGHQQSRFRVDGRGRRARFLPVKFRDRKGVPHRSLQRRGDRHRYSAQPVGAEWSGASLCAGPPI